MTNKEPLFPYNNLFITARPGTGATTLAISIVNKYSDLGKRCLVFENTSGTYYLERLRAVREKKGRPISPPRIDKYGNLTVIYNYFFDAECILSKVIEHSCDVVVYEAPNALLDQDKELKKITFELKKRGIRFIFITHLKRKINPLSRAEIITPIASRHRRAIAYFDSAAIIYRQDSYGVERELSGEIRLYERGAKSYRAVPVIFDFEHDCVRLKGGQNCE